MKKIESEKFSNQIITLVFYFCLREENEKKNDVVVFDDVSYANKVEVKDDKEHLEEEPKYGILRKISQKKEQEFLNHPSLLCVGVILVTLVKLFVQIFDMLTDTIISKSFLI